MKFTLCFLSTALTSMLLAQAQGPVQTVGTGRATPQYENRNVQTRLESHYAPNPVQNTIIAPVRNQSQYPTLQEYLAARDRAQTHAYSPEEAEAWVRQYSVNPQNGDDAKIDPVTGLPRYSTTVTLRRASRESGGSESVVPHFAGEFINNLWRFSMFVPQKGEFPHPGHK